MELQLLASSHGRRLVSRLLEQVPQVEGTVMPGARFERVTRDINDIPPGKTIVIIGGTNNTHDNEKQDAKIILQDFNFNKLKTASETNPIIIVEILKRYDDPNKNETIRNLNMKMKKLVKNYKNKGQFYFVKTDDFGPELYEIRKNGTYDIHLNDDGKNILADRIADAYYMYNPRPSNNRFIRILENNNIELGHVLSKNEVRQM